MKERSRQALMYSCKSFEVGTLVIRDADNLEI